MNYSVSINDHDHGHLVTNDVNTYYHNGTVAASAMLAYADASGSPYPPSTFADPHQVAYGAYVTPYAHPEMYVDSSGVHSNEDSNETAEAKKEKAQKLEVFGSAETMNLPQAVILNIKISDFFKDLLCGISFSFVFLLCFANNARRSFRALKTYHEVLSAICDDVEHVGSFILGRRSLLACFADELRLEPWEGFQKPSPAFIYMYKLYKMKMSDKQMRGMLEHENPYVVAIGLLYLRWSLPPTQLWQWFEPLIGDKTKFVVDKKHTSRYASVGIFFRSPSSRADAFALLD
jgi:pre-mRNA-splicing factor 38B